MTQQLSKWDPRRPWGALKDHSGFGISLGKSMISVLGIRQSLQIEWLERKKHNLRLRNYKTSTVSLAFAKMQIRVDLNVSMLVALP